MVVEWYLSLANAHWDSRDIVTFHWLMMHSVTFQLHVNNELIVISNTKLFTVQAENCDSFSTTIYCVYLFLIPSFSSSIQCIIHHDIIMVSTFNTKINTSFISTNDMLSVLMNLSHIDLWPLSTVYCPFLNFRAEENSIYKFNKS